jgi:hypothetical protein
MSDDTDNRLEEGEEQVEDLNLTFDDIDVNVLMESLRPVNEFSPSVSTPSAAAAVASLSEWNSQESDEIDNSPVECSRFRSSGKSSSACAVAASSSSYCASSASSTSPDDSNEYILGTLVVRVVAARDLDPVRKHGLGDLLWGGSTTNFKNGGGKNLDVRERNRGTANPYASVRFGKTTQRTCEVPGTVDPVWPRGESMYMDVTHSSPEEGNNKLEESLLAPEMETFQESTLALDPMKSKTAVMQQNTISKMEERVVRDISNHSAIRKRVPKPLLTVAIFHVHEVGRFHKYPTKKANSSNHGDSDDVFLGMASVDLTPLLTGKVATFDQWLPLSGSNSPRAAVRVVCEYEASDARPHPGDVVRFTDFCHPSDLYPAVANGRMYTVQEVDGDEVVISWTSSEGWVSTFAAHRFMLLCVQRHHSVVDLCQEELVNIRERLAHSPAIHAIQETVDRVPDEGLLEVTESAIKNGLGLLTRWLEGGLQTTTDDITSAINWDGRHNPIVRERLDMCEDDRDEDNQKPAAQSILVPSDENLKLVEPLPNMPACPITGEPMIDPVVAADGHTYERAAIARWLSESDKSPLTGSVLAHKELVPNYMLLSSLQDAAMFAAAVAPPPTVEESSVVNAKDKDEDDVVTDIKIN